MAREGIYSLSQVPAQELTPNGGDDYEASLESPDLRAFDWNSVVEWRVAESLLVLRQQVDILAPKRSKSHDGTIGDLDHRLRKSDHNPHVRDGATHVVTALDITDDPDGGCDVGNIAEELRQSRDERIKYVIWNRRLFSSYDNEGIPAWGWRSYGGENPHAEHAHVSVLASKELYDSVNLWALQEAR